MSDTAKALQDLYNRLNNPPSPELPDGAEVMLTAADELHDLRDKVRQMREWAPSFREVITDPDELAEFDSAFNA